MRHGEAPATLASCTEGLQRWVNGAVDPKYESFLPFGGTNSHTVTQFFQCTWMGSAYETVANGRIALVRQAEFSLTTCEIAGVVPLL